MNINWNEVFSNDFWFGVDTTMLHRSDYWILYAGIALLVFGIATAIYRAVVKNEFIKSVAARLARIFVIIGLLEIIWYGMRYENAVALATKFTAVLIALAGLIWLYWPIKYLVSRYNLDMANAERKVMRDKYLNYRK